MKRKSIPPAACLLPVSGAVNRSPGLFWLTEGWYRWSAGCSSKTARLALSMLLLAGQAALAQNPLITNQFTADPSARVFGDSIYIYPSHDIAASEGKGRPNWFAMEDYHVFSSANLTDWHDSGPIVTQNKVPWVKPDSYSMWAPDCIYRNGRYYFYFPSTSNDTTQAKGFTVGVAIANKPGGPFVPQPQSIKGVQGIDPNVFIDKDGQAYLYWSQRSIFVAKLKENMLELASAVDSISNLPAMGLKEGPYLFERNGIYYLTYPHVENRIERLEYATGSSPLGPFTVRGVIMDESPTGCWTNHHSILPYKGQWYLFYHHNDLSPKFDKNRSIRADSLSFNADGTIRKVVPTLRGIGLTDARSPIQLDRYSRLSATGASIAFLDTANTFRGWKTVLTGPDAWVQYNSVQFGKTAPKKVVAKASSPAGGTLLIKAGSGDGPVIATLTLPPATTWQQVSATLPKPPTGVHHLVAQWKGNATAELDWVRFE